MNDTSTDNARSSMETCVTKAGEAIGERMQSAATAAADKVQKLVQDATASATAAAGRAKKALDDAGEAAQQAWSQAGGVAEDVVDVGRRTTRSASRKIGENPLIAVLVSCALGYVAGWSIHRRR